MKFKGTIWFLLIFAGLISYYFLIDTPSIKKAEEEKALAEKILPFDPDDVQEIILTKSENKIHVKRSANEEWDLLEPVKDKGDSITIDALLTFVKGLRFSKVVDEDPKDLSPYSLDKPSLTINIKFKGGTEKSLMIGNRSQVGAGTFIKSGGEKKVLLAVLHLPSLDKSLYDLRDKTILEYNTTEVTGFDLQRTENTLHFSKDVNTKHWTFSGPVSTRADDDAVENFLNSVRIARAKSFKEESPTDLSPYDLDKPAIVLKVKHSNKATTTELRIGKKDTSGYFAQVDTRKPLITIDEKLFQKLNQNYLDLMSKALLHFNEEDITSLQIRNLEEITLLNNSAEDGTWRLTQPKESPADAAAVKSLLMDLKAARVKEFVKFARDDLKLFGLDKPRKELSINFGKGKSASIKIGNSTSDEKQYFASRSVDGMIFVVDADIVDKIFRSHHDLKYRKLLSFESNDVQKILLQYPDKNFELKLEDKNWSLISPEKISNIKPFIAKDILWTLSNLEYDSILPSPTTFNDTGLDKPQLRVTIYDSKDEELGTIAIGKKAEDKSKHFAQISGKPKIYLIKERFLDEIPADLEKFKK
ncbi:MAG: DUF4340 domain-containing protein [Nitrospinales bacterium]